MNFLIASILLLSPRAQALDLGLGVGFIHHDAGYEGFGRLGFIGFAPELSYVQKVESLWIEFGLSALVGHGLVASSGFSTDEIRGGGFHIDAGFSLLRSSFLDLKCGVGAGAKLLERVYEENSTDDSRNYHLESRRTRTVFQIAARGMAALNVHGKDGIGGIEFRPFKGEMGRSFFDITPSLAVYWPI